MIEVDQNFLDEIRDNIDLLEYAESQGFEFRRQGKEYFTNCPLHTDNTPSLSITEDEDGMHRSFFCHSCKTGGGIIKWLTKIEHLKFMQAVEKASKLANMDVSMSCQSPTVNYIRKQNRELKKVEYKTEIQHVVLNDSMYTKYSIEQIPEWESEGISADTLREFDIRIDNNSNRIVYPVRDINGHLINIKGRTRYEDYKAMRIAKYKNYFPVEYLDYLQCLYKTKQYILDADEIIIFESIKSTMKCWEWGYKNTVSAETHSLTDGQIKTILQLGCSNVVLAFDKDVGFFSAKEKEMRRQISKLSKFVNVFYICDDINALGEKDSPADKDKETWELLYKNKRRWMG